MKVEYRFLEGKEFGPLYRSWYATAFSERSNVDLDSFYSEEEQEKLLRLDESFKIQYRVRIAVYVDDKFAGWSWGLQVARSEFYMCNSAVLPEYRRKGLYTGLLNTMMEKVISDGFQEITSKHLMDNNDVLIPKLKKGFSITGFEVNPRFGSLVKLTYFPNKNVEETYKKRIGSKS